MRGQGITTDVKNFGHKEILDKNLIPIEGPIIGEDIQWKANDVKTTQTTAAAMTQVINRSFTDALEDVQEKLIAKNNLRSVSFLEYGIVMARSVAHITLPGRGTATGFLIANNILMTNNHVFTEASDAAGAIIRFNYQQDLEGNLLPTEEFEADPDRFFHTNDKLDYSIVKVKGNPGEKWGVLKMAKNIKPQKRDDVTIIQHPAGQPKQIALVDNEIEYVDNTVIQYLTDTLPGSSGSPVFDEYWRLIALHHSGGWIPEPGNQSTHFRNEGILMSAIAADLPSWE